MTISHAFTDIHHFLREISEKFPLRYVSDSMVYESYKKEFKGVKTKKTCQCWSVNNYLLFSVIEAFLGCWYWYKGNLMFCLFAGCPC